MLRWVCAIPFSILVACGPARPAPSTTPEAVAEVPPPDCDELRESAATAHASLERCRETTPAIAWAHRDAFEWLEAHLGAHLAAAREGEPPATTIVEVQEIAERVWTLLDEVRDDAHDTALLDRTEDATEALMREHQPEPRERAFAALAGALGALRADLEPDAPPSCEPEERAAAVAWMAAQAQCSDLDGSEL